MGSARRLACLLLPRLPQLCAPPPPALQRPLVSRLLAPLPRQSTWLARPQLQLQLRSFTTTAARAVTPKEPVEPEKKLTIYQRFKQTYKTHGKILVVVHACTSACWFSCFYVLVRSGVDVIGVLESMNVSKELLDTVRSSPWVDFALASLLHKLMSPVRYAVTIGTTQMVVKQFRSTGRIPEVRDEDRLRNLAKESQASMKEMAKDKRENLSQQYKARKAKLSQQYRERKENIRAAARRRLLRSRSRRKARRDSER